MPLSGADLAGIHEFGHRWCFEISLRGQTDVMAKMTEETPEAEVETCAMAIVHTVMSWLSVQGMRPRPDDNMIASVTNAVEQLEFAADCGIEEVREALSVLYDQFDFYRICVVN